MNDTVTVIVAHRLGKVEAVRRLKEGFARTDGHLGGMIVMEQETWQGDTLRFGMRALGQTAAAKSPTVCRRTNIERHTRVRGCAQGPCGTSDESFSACRSCRSSIY